LLCYAGFSYPADARRGVLRLEPRIGATLVACRESLTGAIQAFLRLDHAISPSDVADYPIAFVVHVSSGERALPRLRYHAANGNLQLNLRTQFRSPYTPEQIWHFSGPDVVDAEYPLEDNVLPVTKSAAYEHAFTQLVPN